MDRQRNRDDQMVDATEKRRAKRGDKQNSRGEKEGMAFSRYQTYRLGKGYLISTLFEILHPPLQ